MGSKQLRVQIKFVFKRINWSQKILRPKNSHSNNFWVPTNVVSQYFWETKNCWVQQCFWSKKYLCPKIFVSTNILCLNKIGSKRGSEGVGPKRGGGMGLKGWGPRGGGLKQGLVLLNLYNHFQASGQLAYWHSKLYKVFSQLEQRTEYEHQPQTSLFFAF